MLRLVRFDYFDDVTSANDTKQHEEEVLFGRVLPCSSFLNADDLASATERKDSVFVVAAGNVSFCCRRCNSESVKPFPLRYYTYCMPSQR